jgi:hypothetical protein
MLSSDDGINQYCEIFQYNRFSEEAKHCVLHKLIQNKLKCCMMFIYDG